ncbi:histidinol-phosphate transaminase [Oceanimonas baumannii]|uniref:Histidinol-phosphate aminotransferase n=1 Tax=Oceanimonas baumannii TaxID=129578 RepID=A0A235CIN3_9GAMM|nr:histidinol-phosphate transaminase [Oceanimonas baumannii]OYD23887.1 histidinol-phosphate transaminase [Oceanimonas baumannii]TDW58782.1 histidinol-phosphate aminotransferase [Oceanimonas baumannii]
MSPTLLARAKVQQLTPYQSARRIGGQGHIWLNANEAADSGKFNLDCERLNRYPECQPPQVIQAYAAYAGVSPEQVLVSRGGDEGIELLIRTFCEPGEDRILISSPTYGMYAISAETNGVHVVDVPLTAERQPDFDGIIERLDEVKLVFLCSPNNPTGDLVNRDGLLRLLNAARGRALVVVDEAYIEFCPEHSQAALLADYDNLVIIRTLSKAFGLAGIRCGFTLASPEVIGLLLKVIAPYPVAEPVAQIAAQALSEQGLVLMRNRVDEINRLKDELARSLLQHQQVREVFAPNGNYLLVRFSPGSEMFARMSRAGIILRDFASRPGLSDCIRITIGNRAEMDAVLNVLQKEQ